MVIIDDVKVSGFMESAEPHVEYSFVFVVPEW